MVDFTTWLGPTILLWGIGMWGLILAEKEIVFNNLFFYGSFVIWGTFVFVILELIEWNFDRIKGDKK